MKTIFRSAVFLSLVLGVVLMGTASAQFTTQTLPTGPTSEEGLLTTITTIMNWVFTIFIIIATLFIILAGFKFVTGGEKGIGEARSMLMWAVVGVVVAVIARGLPLVIKSVISGT